MTGRPSRSSRAQAVRLLAVTTAPAVTPLPWRRTQLVIESSPVVGSCRSGEPVTATGTGAGMGERAG